MLGNAMRGGVGIAARVQCGPDIGSTPELRVKNAPLNSRVSCMVGEGIVTECAPVRAVTSFERRQDWQTKQMPMTMGAPWSGHPVCGACPPAVSGLAGGGTQKGTHTELTVHTMLF